MELFTFLFESTLSALQTNFTIFGFSFSFFDVFAWGTASSIVITFFGRLLYS